MSFKIRVKPLVIVFVLFGLLFSGILLSLKMLIFADSDSFPTSSNAGLDEYSFLTDFDFDEYDPSIITLYHGSATQTGSDIIVNIPWKNGDVEINQHSIVPVEI